MKKYAIAFAICSFAAVFLSPLTSNNVDTSDANRMIAANPASNMKQVIAANPASNMKQMISTNSANVADGTPSAVAGNVIQVPVAIPVNVCANTVGVADLLNAALGNVCAKS
ncbi:MAG TPA: chaplin [Ktedonobacteraceae bacterium]|jgi:hypothetical protein|nr:chaplin [Ktedonobacteraceae bacterium]